jgi:hypothetical protein
VSIELFILGDLSIFVSLVEHKGILQLDGTRNHKVSTILSDASISNKSIDLCVCCVATCRLDSSRSAIRFSGSVVKDESVQSSEAILEWLVVR